jgi:regulator of protease activity HflC (stomatin/prohibitin superfamily)
MFYLFAMTRTTARIILIPQVVIILLGVWVVLAKRTKAFGVMNQFERGVVLRLGRIRSKTKGPGIFCSIPYVDKIIRVGMRNQTIPLDDTPIRIVMADNVTVQITLTGEYRVVDALVAVERSVSYQSVVVQTVVNGAQSILQGRSVDVLVSDQAQLLSEIKDEVVLSLVAWGMTVTLLAIQGVQYPPEIEIGLARKALAIFDLSADSVRARGEEDRMAILKRVANMLHPGASDAQIAELVMRYRTLHAWEDAASGSGALVIGGGNVSTPLPPPHSGR